MKVCLDTEGVIKIEFQDDVNEKITNIRLKLSYTGACKRTCHSFGQISFIPKAVGFEADDDWSCVEFEKEQIKPIGSYAIHSLKKGFQWLAKPCLICCKSSFR